MSAIVMQFLGKERAVCVSSAAFWPLVSALTPGPAVREVLARMGNTIRIGTPEAAQAAFRSELAKYAALVKKVGLEPL